jgi:hypothetical protein
MPYSRHSGGYPPRLVAGEEVCRRASSGLILEIDVGEPLPLASGTMKQVRSRVRKENRPAIRHHKQAAWAE